MQSLKTYAAMAALTVSSIASAQLVADRPQAEERLSFQTQGTWNPRVNLNADVAMVYDIDKTLPERLKTWKDRGYIVHTMSGITWGEYAEYYYGDFDGKNHMDEVQKEKGGGLIGHGKDNYYISPSISYGNFIIKGVKRALDAGAQGIHLEEPEYWVRAGWEEGFKREWQAYYGEPWQVPDSSPDAQYRTSKLKYFLYRRVLGQVFDFVKQYNKEHGTNVKCYVPTHSLINYANWGIVSPQASLLEVGCDGFIAQVWTGTARTPNIYEGRKRERTFETAFLEYGSLQNIARASGKRIWYLNDPIEDNANHSWHDYRTNWESTLVASLLQPEVYHYEIMPWPHRIFQKDYPSTQPVRRNTPRIPMPKEYETELQAVITAMGDMKQPADQVKWLSSGTHNVGILVSDSLMFQRFGPSSSDPEFGHFYGLSLPLLMRGVPVEAVQMELGQLPQYKVLLLSYEGQKPPKPEYHDAIAKWVNDGGALIVVDNDKDPYNAVREWWNTGDNKFATPRHHLFDKLGVPHDKTGLTKVGKGVVIYASESPAALSRAAGGADQVRTWTKQAMENVGIEWRETGSLVLKRGPYLICGGLEDKANADDAYTLKGRFIPLFDAALPTVTEYKVTPGVRGVLVDVDAMPKTGVIAAACRIGQTKLTDNTLEFATDGIAETNGMVVIKMPSAPKTATIDGQPVPADQMSYADGLLRLKLANSENVKQVSLAW